MTEFNQKKYQIGWDKENTVGVKLKLNKRSDGDIIERLQMEPNKQGYIKALIRADIARGEKAEDQK